LLYRYSAFIVLYPPGLISEAWLVYLALTETSGVGLPYRIYLLLGFLTYIPGKLRHVLCEIRMIDLSYSELHYVFAYAVPATTYAEIGQRSDVRVCHLFGADRQVCSTENHNWHVRRRRCFFVKRGGGCTPWSYLLLYVRHQRPSRTQSRISHGELGADLLRRR
jgi:hypothetical protein